MKPSSRNLMMICFALILLFAAVRIFVGSGRGQTKVSYSQFLQQVRDAQVANVTITPGDSGASRVTGRLKNGTVVRTVFPPHYQDAIAAMQDKLVNIEIQDSSGPLPLLLNATPFLVLLGLWVVMMRRLETHPRPSSAG